MSLLASLVRAYERMPDAPPFRYSLEKIGFCVVLNDDGSVSEVIDLRGTDNRRSPKKLRVPSPKKRTRGIDPNFLWDNTSYVLGVTSQQDSARVEEKHERFRNLHLERLAGSADTGLLALRNFLETWRAVLFKPPTWPGDMDDQNVVFRLAGEDAFIHDRTAAKELWRELSSEEDKTVQTCLVTGEAGPVERLHPSIKGVQGAQSSGASLISFNRDAFKSYDHNSGYNAPVSKTAAFAYATALNSFLSGEDHHRIGIGDTSTVFWADAETGDFAQEAEALAAGFFNVAGEESDAESRVKDKLEQIRNGEKLKQIAPNLAEGVRFYVLGLAPNASRLSVRFFWEGDFGTLTNNYQTYLDDTRLDPPPRDGWPPLWKYLVKLAAQGKRKNIPPKLAGEWMRAILSGTPYPLTLMSTTLMRIRADGEIDALRVAILKSVLIRNLKMEVPVALDPANTNKGYILGRLFAAYEQVQRAALGGNVNATIKDKFYGAASAMPRKIFPRLDADSRNHFAKLRKQYPGRAVNLEKQLTSIMDLMNPDSDPIPVSLNSGEQALFGIGYYHQRSDFFRKPDDKTPEVTQ